MDFMRKIISTLFILQSIAATAQSVVSLKKSSNTLKPVVEQVARDFYQNFNNVKGDTLNQSEETIEFASRISPPDAISTSITKYLQPYSYTWEATMFQTENYEEAVEKYKSYYRQLNGAKLTFYDKTAYHLSGRYDAPDEARAFASSILQLNPSNNDLQLFKVEIGLSYSLPEWTVKVMIYEKIADDKIRPTIEVPVR
jgi:ABC-type antimicrobial peptide transport system permease subunit